MSSSPLRCIVIVGAGAAGISAAEALRDEGFSGRIIMIGDERETSYDRPPLSKQILLGTVTVDDIVLRTADFFSDNDIELLQGVTATALDVTARQLTLDNGTVLSFDGLIVATGLRARQLPGQPMLQGMHTLRTHGDAQALRSDLLQASKVLVIGAGFLGSEIAASASQLGAQVVMLDSADTPMQRQLGRTLGDAVARLHQERGVRVLCNTSVQQIHGSDQGRVQGVTLTDGTRLDADVVVVAIGSTTATDWLESSGLALDNGIVCDAYCQAAPGIFAAGDVASWFSQRLQTQVRLEHRMNATEHGMAAAQNLLGAAVPFDPVPFFWTDLYNVKIQGFGMAGADSEMHVLTGTPGESGFTGALVSADRIEAVVGWNAPRQVRNSRNLVGSFKQFASSIEE